MTTDIVELEKKGGDFQETGHSTFDAYSGKK
jgi:hypothetical protein